MIRTSRAPASGPTLTERAEPRGAPQHGVLGEVLMLALVLAGAVFLRVWQLDSLGYNTDEAVYAGQAAALVQDPTLKEFFPVFRAHPILIQTLLAVVFLFGVSDINGRLLSAAFGVMTVYSTYRLGRELYGERVGLLAALFLALMPYHVVVTRQVLLDGPMTLFATLALYTLARFTATRRAAWLYATGAFIGLTMLSKTNGIVILGSLYVFLALSPAVRVRLRDLALMIGFVVLVFSVYPLTLSLAGRTNTGGQYLAWQLFRRPNHEWSFYSTVVTEAIGPAVIAVAIAGLWLLRRQSSWREVLLISWIVVPVTFFQLWPTKGFQYLLPLAPVFAILAGRAAGALAAGGHHRLWRWRINGVYPSLLVAGIVAVTIAIPSWQRIQPPESDVFMAGSGGVPGGREAGRWIRDNAPSRAQLLAIGPSMANIIQFYGHRKAYGLAVSPNPLRRNPSYEPVNNPDLRIRNNEIQYVVWDSFSAERTPFFADSVLRYANKYHGRVVHTQSVSVTTQHGSRAEKPVIVIYEVRP